VGHFSWRPKQDLLLPVTLNCHETLPSVEMAPSYQHVHRSVSPSVRSFQRNSHWMDFHENSYVEVLWKSASISEVQLKWGIYIYIIYTECPRRNVPDFGRVFLMLKYTDITQNTYAQSWTVTEIKAREKWGLLVGPRTVPVSWQSYPFPSLSVVSYDSNSAHASHWTALHI